MELTFHSIPTLRPFFSRQGAALAHLNSISVRIDSCVLLLLEKSASSPTAGFLIFGRPSFAQVSLLKPAPFYKLSGCLGSTNKFIVTFLRRLLCPWCFFLFFSYTHWHKLQENLSLSSLPPFSDFSEFLVTHFF